MAAETFFDPPDVTMPDLNTTVEEDEEDEEWTPHTSQPLPPIPPRFHRLGELSDE